MPTITHVFHIDKPQEEVFEKLITVEAIKAWWTEDTVGTDGPGGELTFIFNGTPLCTMKVVDQTAPNRLEWECIKGYPDWVGTRVTYELSQNDGKTKVFFTHSGWAEQTEFFAQCNFSWGRYMVSLRDLCEKGKGDPWPMLAEAQA